MTRLRRIADSDRIFFVTTNLRRDVTTLSVSERTLALQILDEIRNQQRFLLLGFAIMPDHAHLLVAMQSGSISVLMHQWKFKTAHSVQRLRGASGPFWQRRYFDFICRRAHDVSDKLEYIHHNPVTAGLVLRPEDWLWSSAGFYRKTSLPPIPIDQMDFSGDPDEILWPAPWGHA